jgi:hypothetical protein
MQNAVRVSYHGSIGMFDGWEGNAYPDMARKGRLTVFLDNGERLDNVRPRSLSVVTVTPEEGEAGDARIIGIVEHCGAAKQRIHLSAHCHRFRGHVESFLSRRQVRICLDNRDLDACGTCFAPAVEV